MPEGFEVNVELGEFAKPADTFIRKLSKGMGGMFAYPLAKAEAKAAVERAKGEVLASLEKAKGEIAVTELNRRAAYRFVEEQALHQLNMESIAAQAVPLISEAADPERLDDDWVTNFFDKSRIVSDEEMQELWSKVLAGEANAPGSFSKRTVNFLSSFDKIDAELFSRLCGFCWEINGQEPIVYNEQDDVYKDNGVNFEALTHLASIGLIQFDALSGFAKFGLRKTLLVKYFNSPLLLNFPKEEDNEFAVGKVMLTSVGRELVKLVKATEVPGFRAYCEERWSQFAGVVWQMVDGEFSTTTSTAFTINVVA